MKAVFIDVGGVLLKQDSLTFEHYDREMAWPPGRSIHLWKEYLEMAHVGGELVPGYRCDVEVGRIKQRLYATNRVVSGMEEIVRELRAMCRLAVISNFSADLDQVLDELGLLSSIELVVNSAFVGTKKPGKRIYEIACNRLGVEPSESVFIDDDPKNVNAAQTLGLKGITFSAAGTLRKELRMAGLAIRYS
jgi:HAD superfamily hydrolase (TIGR01509 family)